LAKAALLRIRIAEKQNQLVERDKVNELIDGIAGVVLTHLSGLAARCSSDLTERHKIDAVVHQVRTEIAEHCIKIADEAANRPWGSRIDDVA
jgi:hypothetical protein